MKKLVAVHLAEGFEEIEAISIIDVLRRAQIETQIISMSGNKLVTGSHGISVLADSLFEEADYNKYDMLVLPGGMPGSMNLKNHAGLSRRILQFHREGKYLGAICAAPIVFGHLGILQGCKATCFPGFEDQLTGAIVTGSDVECSGTVITGKGAGVAIQFALEIVKMLIGEASAKALATKMIVH